MARKINNMPMGDDYAQEMKEIKQMKKPAKKKVSPVPVKKKNPMINFMKKRNKK